MDLATEAGNTTYGILQILKDEPYNFWIGLRKSRFIQEENGNSIFIDELVNSLYVKKTSPKFKTVTH